MLFQLSIFSFYESKEKACSCCWLPKHATCLFCNLGTFSRLKLDAIPNPNVVKALMKVQPSICPLPHMHFNITLIVIQVQVIDKYEFQRVEEMHLLIRRNPFAWVLTPCRPPHAFPITGKPQLGSTNPKYSANGNPNGNLFNFWSQLKATWTTNATWHKTKQLNPTYATHATCCAHVCPKTSLLFWLPF